MRQIAAIALAASAIVAAVATPAVADPGPVTAPYARGVAVVNLSGSLDSGKHVVDSKSLGTGRYCVTFDDTIQRDGAVAVAQANDWGDVNVFRGQTSSCNGPHDFLIGTMNRQGNNANAGFTLAVL